MKAPLIRLLFLGGLIASQTRGQDVPIADNSFLIEEAYNQEAGVVQHISTFEMPTRGSDWSYNCSPSRPAFPFCFRHPTRAGTDRLESPSRSGWVHHPVSDLFFSTYPLSTRSVERTERIDRGRRRGSMRCGGLESDPRALTYTDVSGDLSRAESS